LIVEDDYIVATELEAGLVDAGFDVVGIAPSATAAVSLGKSERPDVAIMDVRLRGPRDGVEAALELYRASGLRCIFATAHQEAALRARAEPARPFGWLAKPYQIDAVVSLIRRAVGVEAAD
jgi:DNA-binding NarL/FixJ family response regulator